MPTSMENKEGPPLYLVSDAKVDPCIPSGKQNLTELYGLTDLAASVARFDPVTGEKKKLRKSYKNQIADLWGKHAIPDNNSQAGGGSSGGDWSLLSLSRQPRFQQSDPPRAPPRLQTFDQKTLQYSLSLDPSPTTGIPGFDGSLLAAPSGAAYSLVDNNQGNASGNDGGRGGGSGNDGPGTAGRGYSRSPFYQTHSRRNGSLSAAAMTAESSNDDSTGLTKRFKKKRKEEYEDGGVKKRKKTQAMN